MILDVASAQNERFTALADVIDHRNLQLVDQARLLALVGKLRPTLITGYRDAPMTQPKNEQQVAAPDLPTRARFVAGKKTLPRKHSARSM